MRAHSLRQLIAAPDEDAIVDALTEMGVYDPGLLKAIFVIGVGGAGKGRVSKAMFAGRGLRYINQDKHLERFLTDKGIPLKKAGRKYGTFKKAQALARKERDAYADQRLGLLIDSTGWDYPRIALPVERLRERGYDCYMLLVHVSYETALARNWQRGQTGGRFVPKDDLARTFDGVRRNVPKYIKLFGRRNFVAIDNDKPLDDETWKKEVEPQLARWGDEFLSRPIKNPKGRRWIASQLKKRDIQDPVVAQTADRLLGKRESVCAVFPPHLFETLS